MSQRHSLACGGLPPKGGEAFKSCRWATGARTRYFILTGVIKNKGMSPCEDGARAMRVGICLSKAWTWIRVQDCLQGLSGWHLQTGLPVQQQVFPAIDVPAAHAGRGLLIPNANMAIRSWTRVLKRTATLKQLQYHECISSPVMLITFRNRP